MSDGQGWGCRGSRGCGGGSRFCGAGVAGDVGRFRALGVEGFYPDSRRPRHRPTRLPVELEDVLITIRKQEAEAGWDYGADAVLMRLEEQLPAGTTTWPSDRGLPARSTVNRVFEDRGQLAKMPQRKPRRRKPQEP